MQTAVHAWNYTEEKIYRSPCLGEPATGGVNGGGGSRMCFKKRTRSITDAAIKLCSVTTRTHVELMSGVQIGPGATVLTRMPLLTSCSKVGWQMLCLLHSRLSCRAFAGSSLGHDAFYCGSHLVGETACERNLSTLAAAVVNELGMATKACYRRGVNDAGTLLEVRYSSLGEENVRKDVGGKRLQELFGCDTAQLTFHMLHRSIVHEHIKAPQLLEDLADHIVCRLCDNGYCGMAGVRCSSLCLVHTRISPAVHVHAGNHTATHGLGR